VGGEMKADAIFVFGYEGDMFFRFIEHHGEHIEDFFLGSSHKIIPENESYIMAGTYRKNGKLYTTIAFESGSFEDLPHFSNITWTTYRNYGVLLEFIDGTIKMSFFREQNEIVNTNPPYLPNKKVWLRYPIYEFRAISSRRNSELALPPNSGVPDIGCNYVR
jgi:hypothetical protein